jgi:hypothetical protein
MERAYVSQKPSLSFAVAQIADKSWKTAMRSSGIQTIDEIFEVTVYQVLILPAKYLAHGRVAEKDFTPGREDEYDGLAQLGHQEICPALASRELPWVNILLTWL